MVKRDKGFRGERELCKILSGEFPSATVRRFAVSGVGKRFPDLLVAKNGRQIAIEVKRSSDAERTYYNTGYYEEDKTAREYIDTILFAEDFSKAGIPTTPLLAFRKDYAREWKFFEIEDRKLKITARQNGGMTISELNKYFKGKKG